MTQPPEIVASVDLVAVRCRTFDTGYHAKCCAWRIVISPMIPRDFPSCYYSSMRNLAVLVILCLPKMLSAAAFEISHIRGDEAEASLGWIKFLRTTGLTD
jgi:hypothetical protein